MERCLKFVTFSGFRDAHEFQVESLAQREQESREIRCVGKSVCERIHSISHICLLLEQSEVLIAAFGLFSVTMMH